jgi:hypothetical protein
MKISACAALPFSCESRPLQDASWSGLHSVKLIEAFLRAGEPVALVCPPRRALPAFRALVRRRSDYDG